ncbi:rhodanese domain-containing protein [Gymnopilus junonius]|uniref:Rhodanese domain-containing protein n=1 Tax=Gymnopilus junonius TaxID=109634 RepID=A0A9P5TI62_GYMJU|nr:rhodanese domain-containing protein [Gymnopilus junonius]
MIGLRTSLSSNGSASKSSRSTTGPASIINDTALVPRTTPALRTLDDVREQVAQEIAIHTITKAKLFDGVRIGVRLVMSKSEDEDFLRRVPISPSARYQQQSLSLSAPSPSPVSLGTGTLVICGSSQEYVQRAVLLASSKFIGRIVAATSGDDELWMATVQDLGIPAYDEDALWDVVHKAARRPMDPLAPPPGSRSIDDILADARSKLQRITPVQAYEELRETQVGAPTFLVDIRPQAQREREGGIHGSLIIERNVLEWRFDPRSSSRLAIADRYDLRIIIFCQEGYTSSLAAYSLQQMGLLNATDIIGGYEAWKNAGLPIDLDRRESRSLVSLAGSVV